MSNPCPQEFREDVVRDAGVTLAHDFGIHPMTLPTWLRQTLPLGRCLTRWLTLSALPEVASPARPVRCPQSGQWRLKVSGNCAPK